MADPPPPENPVDGAQGTGGSKKRKDLGDQRPAENIMGESQGAQTSHTAAIGNTVDQEHDENAGENVALPAQNQAYVPFMRDGDHETAEKQVTFDEAAKKNDGGQKLKKKSGKSKEPKVEEDIDDNRWPESMGGLKVVRHLVVRPGERWPRRNEEAVGADNSLDDVAPNDDRWMGAVQQVMAQISMADRDTDVGIRRAYQHQFLGNDSSQKTRLMPVGASLVPNGASLVPLNFEHQTMNDHFRGTLDKRVRLCHLSGVQCLIIAKYEYLVQSPSYFIDEELWVKDVIKTPDIDFLCNVGSNNGVRTLRLSPGQTVDVPDEWCISNKDREVMTLEEVRRVQRLMVQLVREGLPIEVYDNIVEIILLSDPRDTISNCYAWRAWKKQNRPLTFNQYEAIRCCNIGVEPTIIRKAIEASGLQFFRQSKMIFDGSRPINLCAGNGHGVSHDNEEVPGVSRPTNLQKELAADEQQRRENNEQQIDDGDDAMDDDRDSGKVIGKGKSPETSVKRPTPGRGTSSNNDSNLSIQLEGTEARVIEFVEVISENISESNNQVKASTANIDEKLEEAKIAADGRSKEISDIGKTVASMNDGVKSINDEIHTSLPSIGEQLKEAKVTANGQSEGISNIGKTVDDGFKETREQLKEAKLAVNGQSEGISNIGKTVNEGFKETRAKLDESQAVANDRFEKLDKKIDEDLVHKLDGSLSGINDLKTTAQDMGISLSSLANQFATVDEKQDKLMANQESHYMAIQRLEEFRQHEESTRNEQELANQIHRDNMENRIRELEKELADTKEKLHDTANDLTNERKLTKAAIDKRDKAILQLANGERYPNKYYRISKRYVAVASKTASTAVAALAVWKASPRLARAGARWSGPRLQRLGQWLSDKAMDMNRQ
ncbi:hypothetical protein PFICI_03171 [Pestalotiopsis fici W106-1]|uniref:Uncharacterized protein n=1 Tax=Pestalotiopsis fici (strain W106-1 / CGMCC3.15140) TaxID=1229662 RepID=W3XIU0_PESFW|nr:uncharacterized protein PFICI_03171 [Pestalotiopsis fici W106-1]ETS85146.1 hypothetical protein PFICI_03171 [Pestalotiopsis fici W106-1]